MKDWSEVTLKTSDSLETAIKVLHTGGLQIALVVDNKGRLLGTVTDSDIRRALLKHLGMDCLVEEVMNKSPTTALSSDSSDSIMSKMKSKNLLHMPVIDEKGVLLGRITIDDVMDVVKEEAEKDYQMASGITEDVESSDSVWQLTRARLPWLLIGLAGGLLGAKVIGIFDIANNFKLAFFIPLIAAMGGNVGVQSAAIVVQGLANESIKINTILSKLVKELGVALLNGIICSAIIFGATFALNYPIDLSLTVSLSLLAVIVFAALFGTFVPLALDKYKIDPALATGPFITTVNDILGLVIYFLIGQAILV